MFNLCVIDKEKNPGNPVKLTIQTLQQQLEDIDINKDINYTYLGENIKDLPVLKKVSTYSTQPVQKQEQISPMERIKRQIADLQEINSFQTPEQKKRKDQQNN